jgi:pimeloyl-ACP methyl ester carboxylesterase
VFSVEVRQEDSSRSVPVVEVAARPRLSAAENDRGFGRGENGQYQVPRERLGELADRAGVIWPDDEVDSSLWQRVLGDAANGNLLGQTPESWSPLGSAPNSETLEQLREAARLEDESDARHGLDRAGGVRIGRNDRRLVIPEISLLDGDGDPLGAVVFGSICCVAVLPGDTEEFRLDYLPTDTEQRAEDDAARDVLSDYAVGETYQIVVWRTYFGSNTHITDAVSGLGQWVQSAGRSIARGAGVLVGRIIHARAHPKKYLHDFTRHKRLRKALSLDPNAWHSLPDLRDIGAAKGNVVIAVHGTMACAVPLATEIRRILAGDVGVGLGRFEHDTWLPVAQNARELAEFLDSSRADRVTLIAHSRGGLVATMAARLTAHSNVQVITLGTPFRGTPVAHAGELPVLGYRSLLGVIRGLSGGFAPVSLSTRLAGFLVKEVPEGIQVMEPRWCENFSGPPPKLVAAVCGSLTEQTLQHKDTYQFHALAGVRSKVFAGVDNDLVVSTASATGDHTSPTIVDCDHFSYLEVDEVADVLKSVVGTDEGAFGLPPSWYRQAQLGNTRI